MLSADALLKRISEEISIINIFTEPANLYAPVNYTLSRSGKRIRPLLTLAACQMFDEDIEPALPVALAYEIFHNFTLLHDDVMDKSEMRRGDPTVHKKWNANTAILSGDAMMIMAYNTLSKSKAEYLPKLLNMFNKTALEVCEGQQFDMDFETRNDVTIPEYLNMIRLKTSVLIAACLYSGAVCGGASDEYSKKLYQIGIDLGMAFQLQDDLLDTFGTSAQFGKRIGGDILEEKKTFLLLKAFEIGSTFQIERLNYALNSIELSEQDKIMFVKDIFEDLNIKDSTIAEIEKRHSAAIMQLAELDIPDGRKKILYWFADFLKNRNK